MSISGKTLDFVYQRPGGFGNFFQKKWIGIFFFQKTKTFLVRPWILFTNDLVVLAIFLPKKSGLELFSPKKKLTYCSQNLGFRLPTTRWFWLIFCQKRVDWHFFLPKNENWHDLKIGKNTKIANLVNLF